MSFLLRSIAALQLLVILFSCWKVCGKTLYWNTNYDNNNESLDNREFGVRQQQNGSIVGKTSEKLSTEKHDSIGQRMDLTSTSAAVTFKNKLFPSVDLHTETSEFGFRNWNQIEIDSNTKNVGSNRITRDTCSINLCGVCASVQSLHENQCTYTVEVPSTEIIRVTYTKKIKRIISSASNSHDSALLPLNKLSRSKDSFVAEEGLPDPVVFLDGGVHCTSSCGICANVTSAGGIIQSPNYPNDYGKLQDCLIIIDAPLGNRIRLTFDIFNVEECCDQVSVYDGTSEALQLQLNGYLNPSPSVTKSNKMTVRFTSDISNTLLLGTGMWQAKFTVERTETTVSSTEQPTTQQASSTPKTTTPVEFQTVSSTETLTTTSQKTTTMPSTEVSTTSTTDTTTSYTTMSSTLPSTTTISSTVPTTTTISSTGQSTTTISSTLPSTTTMSSTLLSTTISSTVPTTTTISSTGQSTTTISSTLPSTTTMSSTGQSTTTISSTVQSTTTISSTGQSTTTISSTGQSTTTTSSTGQSTTTSSTLPSTTTTSSTLPSTTKISSTMPPSTTISSTLPSTTFTPESTTTLPVTTVKSTASTGISTPTTTTTQIYQTTTTTAVVMNPTCKRIPRNLCVNVTSTGGVIQSPNYPNEYRNNIDSNYTIEVSSGKVIMLTFNEFVVEQNYDHVQIFEGTIRLSPVLTGYRLPKSVTSESNKITVVFKSDNVNTAIPSSYGVGRWQATFTLKEQTTPVTLATTPAGATTAIAIQAAINCTAMNFITHEIDNDACIDVTSSGGVIQSPSYPKNYDRGLNFKYTIEVPSDRQISLTFHTFLLRNHYDRIIVTDQYSNILATFGKHDTPYTITTLCLMTINFISRNIPSRGPGRWEATFALT